MKGLSFDKRLEMIAEHERAIDALKAAEGFPLSSPQIGVGYYVLGKLVDQGCVERLKLESGRVYYRWIGQ